MNQLPDGRAVVCTSARPGACKDGWPGTASRVGGGILATRSLFLLPSLSATQRLLAIIPFLPVAFSRYR